MSFDKDRLKKYKALVGCDEVGRGPLAGPVVTCAVRLNKSSISLLDEFQILKITDSKKISPTRRRNILNELELEVQNLKPGIVYEGSIGKDSYQFCISVVSESKIDQINILQASLMGMKTSVENVAKKGDLILIDGNKSFDTSFQNETVVKGDSKSLVIGLASIIAKEFRDQKMLLLSQKYPGYLLEKNAGYPTKEHLDAIKKLGPSEIHRKTFKGVKEYFL